MRTLNGKRYIGIGERLVVELPFSEVNMYMRVAGERMEVALVNWLMVQIFKDGRPFSAPITYGEAGIFKDENGYYTYEP